MDLDDGGSPWDDVPPQPTPNPKAATDDSTPKSAESSSSKPKPSSGAKGRAARGPKRIVPTHSTKLESADDVLGPLGPLGDNFRPADSEETLSPGLSSPDLALPTQHQQQQQQQQPPRTPAGSNASLRTLMGSVDLDDDGDEQAHPGPRVPPPVQPPNSEPSQRNTQPSMSIVEASKPSFYISVGDPHKISDITGAHTEYSVFTKTSSKAYRNPEFTVSRRFRDFLWLYNQLHTNNPGIIVPPPPEKQAMGRFNTDFIEGRRQGLDRMLNKIAAHPQLQHDGDLKLFLESDAFNVEIKHKERKEPLVAESKGMFGGLGIGNATQKFVEHDDWFHDRRIYLDALENQLKALHKAVETVVEQRKALSDAAGDFSGSLQSLSTVELSPQLSGSLEGLSEVQYRIKELYDRQAQQDMLTLGIVIEEYVRLIGSCKHAFGMREKSYYSWHAAESELGKKKNTQDKLLRQGRSQQDRLNQLSAEVADAEKKAHQARLLFDDMGRILRQELDRFEREKVEDFKSGVETYLESAVEAQKELIEIWETYLMRLDADDEDEATQASALAVQPPAEETEQDALDEGAAQGPPQEPPQGATEGAAEAETTHEDE